MYTRKEIHNQHFAYERTQFLDIENQDLGKRDKKWKTSFDGFKYALSIYVSSNEIVAIKKDVLGISVSKGTHKTPNIPFDRSKFSKIPHILFLLAAKHIFDGAIGVDISHMGLMHVSDFHSFIEKDPNFWDNRQSLRKIFTEAYKKRSTTSDLLIYFNNIIDLYMKEQWYLICISKGNAEKDAFFVLNPDLLEGNNPRLEIKVVLGKRNDQNEFVEDREITNPKELRRLFEPVFKDIPVCGYDAKEGIEVSVEKSYRTIEDCLASIPNKYRPMIRKIVSQAGEYQEDIARAAHLLFQREIDKEHLRRMKRIFESEFQHLALEITESFVETPASQRGRFLDIAEKVLFKKGVKGYPFLTIIPSVRKILGGDTDTYLDILENLSLALIDENEKIAKMILETYESLNEREKTKRKYLSIICQLSKYVKKDYHVAFYDPNAPQRIKFVQQGEEVMLLIKEIGCHERFQSKEGYTVFLEKTENFLLDYFTAKERLEATAKEKRTKVVIGYVDNYKIAEKVIGNMSFYIEERSGSEVAKFLSVIIEKLEEGNLRNNQIEQIVEEYLIDHYSN